MLDRMSCPSVVKWEESHSSPPRSSLLHRSSKSLRLGEAEERHRLKREVLGIWSPQPDRTRASVASRLLQGAWTAMGTPRLPGICVMPRLRGEHTGEERRPAELSSPPPHPGPSRERVLSFGPPPTSAWTQRCQKGDMWVRCVLWPPRTVSRSAKHSEMELPQCTKGYSSLSIASFHSRELQQCCLKFVGSYLRFKIEMKNINKPPTLWEWSDAICLWFSYHLKFWKCLNSILVLWGTDWIFYNKQTLLNIEKVITSLNFQCKSSCHGTTAPRGVPGWTWFLVAGLRALPPQPPEAKNQKVKLLLLVSLALKTHHQKQIKDRKRFTLVSLIVLYSFYYCSFTFFFFFATQ